MNIRSNDLLHGCIYLQQLSGRLNSSLKLFIFVFTNNNNEAFYHTYVEYSGS